MPGIIQNLNTRETFRHLSGNDEYTKLLIHSNTTDGSTTFTDSSATGHTVTAVGNAQHDTDKAKMGTSSILFDGTGDYLNIADTLGDFSYSDNDFTIDAWIMLSSSPPAYQYIYWHRDFANSQGAFDLQNVSSDTYILRLYMYNGASLVFSANTYNIILSDSTWYHFAVERFGKTVINFYVDGERIASKSASPGAVGAPSEVILGALTPGPSNEFKGRMDEIRVSNEIARYKGHNFEPQKTFYY
jgi:hypothetical protein